MPAYLAAQGLGAILGVGVAHLMFGQALLQISQHVRAGGGQLLSEFVATFGLLCGALARVPNPPRRRIAIGN